MLCSLSLTLFTPICIPVYVFPLQDYAKEIDYLASKVAAGADVIITQMVFDADVYALFVSDCRSAGITVPILPGIMCINVSLSSNLLGLFFCRWQCGKYHLSLVIPYLSV